MKKVIPLLLGLGLVLASCTVVKHGEQNESSDSVDIYFDNGEFDAAAFVDERWASRIVPQVKNKAIEINELLSLKKSDPEKATSGSWAVQKDKTAPVNYMVRGEGNILAVNAESAAATIDVETGGSIIKIQIGPVIKYTSIRDSMEFINFQNFTNQLEFANVSKEINRIVRDEVLADFKSADLMGKKIRFIGCFSNNQEGIILTPVILEILEGGS